jgi:hypothetical protein
MVEVIRGVSRSSPGQANHPAFRIPIKISDQQYDIDGEGGAYFDIQSQFPCKALFLDNEHALLMRKLLDGTYQRIGIGSLRCSSLAQTPPVRVVIV